MIGVLFCLDTTHAEPTRLSQHTSEHPTRPTIVLTPNSTNHGQFKFYFSFSSDQFIYFLTDSVPPSSPTLTHLPAPPHRAHLQQQVRAQSPNHQVLKSGTHCRNVVHRFANGPVLQSTRWCVASCQAQLVPRCRCRGVVEYHAQVIHGRLCGTPGVRTILLRSLIAS